MQSVVLWCLFRKTNRVFVSVNVLGTIDLELMVSHLGKGVACDELEKRRTLRSSQKD